MIEDLKFKKFKVQDTSINGGTQSTQSTDAENEDESIFTMKNFNSVEASIFSNANYEQVEKTMNDKIATADDKDKGFWENIKKFGVKDIFKFLDKNNDGKIDDTELKELSEADNNGKDISAKDMENMFSKMGLLKEDNPTTTQENNTAIQQDNAVQSAQSVQGPYSGGGDYGSSEEQSYSGGQDIQSTQPQGETIEQKIQNLTTKIIPDEEKAIQAINQKADTDIQTEEQKLQKTIDGDSKISNALKTQYAQMQTQETALASKITQNANLLTQKDGELASIDGDISGMESEKSGLNASSDNKDANDKMQARKSEIDTKISDLKNKKTSIQKEKETLAQGKTKLEEEKQKLDTDKNKLLGQITAQASPETQAAIQESKQKIEGIKSKKTQDISAAQDKINASRTELSTLKQEEGKAKGSQYGVAGNLNKYLKGVLANKGDMLASIAEKEGIDPALFGAIISMETGYGTSNAIKNHNNPAGIMDPAANWMKLKTFSSLEEGLTYSAHNLKTNYIDKGLTTIPQIGAKYCPVGAANDPTGMNSGWIPGVTDLYKKYKGA